MGQSETTRRLARAAAVALGLGCGACRAPTAVTLELSTDIDCVDGPETGIAVGRPGAVESSAFSTVTARCDPATGRIGSLVLVPSGGKNGEVAVRVVTGLTRSPDECVRGGYTGGCVVARRFLRFLPHETLLLAVLLEKSCIDVPCEATQTCRAGVCVSAQILDESQCARPEGCDVESAGTGGFGGVVSSAGASGTEAAGEGGGASGAHGGADAGASGGELPPGGGAASRGGLEVGGGGSDPTSSGGDATGAKGNRGGDGAGAGPDELGGTATGGQGNLGGTATGGQGNLGGAAGQVGVSGDNSGGQGGLGASVPGGQGGASGDSASGRGGAAGATATEPDIDATEVTRDAYARWLGGAPDLSAQPPWCVENTDFTPTCNWPPGTDGDHPVVCVDWCDAHAYCEAQGRRLCGAITGGSVPWGSFADAAVSQWTRACTSGGQLAYPYGDTFDGALCNGSAAGFGSTVPVASMSSCHPSDPAYAAIYDLSGNVKEWEDDCDGYVDRYDLCQVRGGGYGSVASALTCAASGVTSRLNSANATIGFRCCAR